ncbi:hypothetical protein HY030_00565 [Candidatus Gottesmanbacteria bacterium]|nr:hypothetical protein [Candidatus Gottesmanbacteria bacterium]
MGIIVKGIKEAGQKQDGDMSITARGIRPMIGPLYTDWLNNDILDMGDKMARADATERILKKLGFLREEGAVESFFALPIELLGNTTSLKGLDWGHKPIRVAEDKVFGLKNKSMPGVSLRLEKGTLGRVALTFVLKPGAILRSLPESH